MPARAARAATSERCRAPLQPCRPAPPGARRGSYGRAQNRRVIRRHSGRGMARSRARAPGPVRRATRDRCASSVTALTLRAGPATTLRTSLRVTRALRTPEMRIAATATIRRSSARAVTSRPDSSRQRESARKAITTHFAISAWDTDRQRGRVLNHARRATRSVTARRAIPRWAAASGSIHTGLASTRRGCDRKTRRCASLVMVARYRVCKRAMTRVTPFMEMSV